MSPGRDSEAADTSMLDLSAAKRRRRNPDAEEHNTVMPQSNLPSGSLSNSQSHSQSEENAQSVEAYKRLYRLYEQQRSVIGAQRVTIERLQNEQHKMRDEQRALGEEVRKLRAGEQFLKKAEQLLKDVRLEVERVATGQGEWRGTISFPICLTHFFIEDFQIFVKRMQRWLNDHVSAIKQEVFDAVKEELLHTLHPLMKMVVIGLVDTQIRSMHADANLNSAPPRTALPEAGPSVHDASIHTFLHILTKRCADSASFRSWCLMGRPTQR